MKYYLAGSSVQGHNVRNASCDNAGTDWIHGAQRRLL
jgi:hypothetical protein